MRLSEIKESDEQLDEFLPAVGQAVGGIARGAAAVGGKIAQGVKAVGSAVGQAAQGFKAGMASNNPAQSGLAGGQMDPAQAAQAKKDHDEQKKQVQDAIKQKQQELADLQKQMAELG